MSYQDCIAALARAAGRELEDDEIEAIYSRISKAAKKLKLGDTPRERKLAAEHAARELLDEAEAAYRKETGAAPDRTLYHGTSEPFQTFDTEEAYLTTTPEEAAGYAQAVHLGGRGGKTPTVLKTVAREGKVLDATAEVNRGIMDEDWDDKDFKAMFARAREQGYRYLEYDHPSNVPGDQEQRVVVSLYPKEDLQPMAAATPAEQTAASQAPAPGTPAEEKKAPAVLDKPIEVRIQRPGVAAELTRMRENTGWAQEGGKFLGGEMGKPNFSTWIPKEYWWPGRPKGLSEAKAKAAITKALAGEPLKAGERRFVEYATEIAESHVAGEEFNPNRAEMKEYDVPAAQADDAALVARAAEKDEDAVERASIQYGEDYAGFMRAVKEIADVEEHAREEAPAAGEPRALEGEGGPGDQEGAGPVATEHDQEIADARNALASLREQGVPLHPEDLAEIGRTQTALEDVDASTDGYLQAALCLKGST